MAFNITTDIPLFSERSPILISSITGSTFDGVYQNYTFNLSSPFDYTDPEIWGDPTVSPYLGIDDLCSIYWLQYDDLSFEPFISLDTVVWVTTTQFTANARIWDTPLANTGLFYVNWIPTITGDKIIDYDSTKYFITNDLVGTRYWYQTGDNLFVPLSTDALSGYSNTTLTGSTVAGNVWGATGGNPDRTLTNYSSTIRFGGTGKVDDNGLSWNHAQRAVTGDLGALPSLTGTGVVLGYLDYSDFSWSTNLLHGSGGPAIEGAPSSPATPPWYFSITRYGRTQGTITQDGTKYFVIHEGQRERIPLTTGTNGVDAFFYSRVFLGSWDVATSSWDYGNQVIAGTGSELEHYYPAEIIEHEDKLYVLVYKDTSWSGYTPEYSNQTSIYSMILDTSGSILKGLTEVTTRSRRPLSNNQRIGKPRITTIDGVESIHFSALHYDSSGQVDYAVEYIAPTATGSHSWAQKNIIDYNDDANYDRLIGFGGTDYQNLPLNFIEYNGLLYAFWASSTDDTNPDTGEFRVRGAEIFYSTRSPNGGWGEIQKWRTGIDEGDWIYVDYTPPPTESRDDWNFSRLIPGAQHYRRPTPFIQNGQLYLFGTKHNAWDLYIAGDDSGDPALRDRYWPYILATGESLYPWAYLY